MTTRIYRIHAYYTPFINLSWLTKPSIDDPSTMHIQETQQLSSHVQHTCATCSSFDGCQLLVFPNKETKHTNPPFFGSVFFPTTFPVGKYICEDQFPPKKKEK